MNTFPAEQVQNVSLVRALDPSARDNHLLHPKPCAMGRKAGGGGQSHRTTGGPDWPLAKEDKQALRGKKKSTQFKCLWVLGTSAPIVSSSLSSQESK